MKKRLLLLFFLLFITGCGSNSKNDYDYINNYYSIATPYKDGVNYTINTINSYDISEVETALMELSMTYFKPNTSYYQDGQYLSLDNLKELLSKEYLNNYKQITIDDVKINPYYVTGIYEQNYLSNTGDLNGISLGIIINPYQQYKNSKGIYLYKQIKEKDLLKIGEEVASKLLKYVREKTDLKENKILIGLYFQSSPNSTMPGSFIKYGITVNNSINFKSINTKYEYITSDYAMKNNNDVYTIFKSLETEIKKNIPQIYLMGTNKYQDGDLKNITININSSHLSKSEILLISQITSSKLKNNNLNNNVIVYIKVNNNIMAIIEKESDKIEPNIHILEGK